MKIEVTFPDKSAERFKGLMERDGLTADELLKNSLRLYEWLSGRADRGEKLYEKVGDEFVEVKLYEDA